MRKTDKANGGRFRICLPPPTGNDEADAAVMVSAFNEYDEICAVDEFLSRKNAKKGKVQK